MSARSRRFTGFGSRSGSGNAAAAVITCAVLLAGCGGSGGSSAEAGAPVIRGDAFRLSGTPSEGIVGTTTITLSTTGGTNGATLLYETTESGCILDGASLTATVAGPCTVTATKGTTTGRPFMFNPPLTVTGPVTGLVGRSITLGARGGFNSGRDVDYTVTGDNCSVEEATSRKPAALTATAAASCEVTAIEAATTEFPASTSSPVTFTFSAPAMTVTADATVTFNANGGIGSITSQSASKATALTLNAGAITRSGYAFNGWNTSASGNGTAYADGGSYLFEEPKNLYATWGCLPLTVTASAKRVGANRAEVTFSAPQSQSPWTSLAAFAAKDGGKGATTVPPSLTTGTIPVTGLDKNSGYTFDVTATNAAGCVYTATANRVLKW